MNLYCTNLLFLKYNSCKKGSLKGLCSEIELILLLDKLITLILFNPCKEFLFSLYALITDMLLFDKFNTSNEASQLCNPEN